MAWTTIKGRRYYRQSYRQNGQVKNRYIGSQELAKLISLSDAERRQARQDAVQAEWATVQQGLETDAQLIQLDRVIKRLLAVAAQESGFRVHHRQLRSRSKAKNHPHFAEHTMLNSTLDKPASKKRPPLVRLSFASGGSAVAEGRK
jgi:hypothetical protein